MICYPFRARENSAYGVDQYCYQLKTGLEQLGLSITTIETKTLPQGKGQWASAELTFFKDLAKVNRDIYHAADVPGAKDAIILGKRAIVTTIHDIEAEAVPESLNARGQIYMRLCRALARKSDRIIVPFEWTKRQVMSLYKIPSELIRVVNYGVDHNSFYPSRLMSHTRRRKRILYVGELNRLKGVATLLNAFRKVLGEIKDAELIYVGTGGDEAELRMLAHRLHVERNVVFTGFVMDRELPRLYHEADVFVWPSRLGFGLTMLQAMASGLPIVGARCCEIPEFLGTSGLLFDGDSYSELADALLRLLSDEKLKTDLARRAHQRAIEFSWGRMARETLSTYKELL